MAGSPGTMTNYEETFRVMSVRRLERELLGTFAKSRPGRNLLLVMGFVALELTLVGVTLNEGAVKVQIQFTTKVLVNLLGGLLLAVLLYVAIQAVPVIRWCLFWIAAGSITALVLNVSTSFEQLIFGIGKGGWPALIAAGTILICIITVLLWYAYHYVYPKAIRERWCCVADLTWFFCIEADPFAPGHYTYRVPLPFPFWLPCCYRRAHRFSYVGEVDEEGRPHGLGTWSDDAKHGECLQGVWQHGVPIGPFRASEFWSDYRFTNIRLAFAKNRQEPCDARTSWWRPTFNEVGLEWGIASLEQSVAGAWFKSLPKSRILYGAAAGSRDAKWCLDKLIALRPETVAPSIVVSASEIGISVSGHELAAGGDPASVTIQLVPAGSSGAGACSNLPSRNRSCDQLAGMPAAPAAPPEDGAGVEMSPRAAAGSTAGRRQRRRRRRRRGGAER